MIFHVIFIGGLCLENILQFTASILNLYNLRKTIAEPRRAFKKIFPENLLTRTCSYLKIKTYFSITKDLFSLLLLFGFIYLGIFKGLSMMLAQQITSPLWQHIIFIGIIFMAYYIISLPFQVFYTFYIEKKFNFSTITVKIFILDSLKVLVLSALLGGILLYVLFLFIMKFKYTWWLWAWLIFTLFSLLLIKIFPSFIAPLFNKFEPLKQNDLRNKIMAVAKKADFTVSNILKSDASKRSRHSNAYFTGMGKNKQIVLFDTLLKQLNTLEITSVLAHEIGHYKKKHIWTMFLLQTLTTGLTMFLVMKLSFSPVLIKAFQLGTIHYLSLFIFSMLFINSFLWIIQFPLTWLSRRNEFSADTFAAKLIGTSRYLIQSLIKLTKDNLSNPYPHPLYSSLYYSHPPLIERNRHLEKYLKLKKNKNKKRKKS